MVRHAYKLFDSITYAIQFDRRGTESIITEMMCGRTCSTEFATALGNHLGMGHQPDPTGSFTDTANLAQIVGECTNISVGYENEHSSHETLDAAYLDKLVDNCIRVFKNEALQLPTYRRPGEFESESNSLSLMSDDDIREFVLTHSPLYVVAALKDLRDSIRGTEQMYGVEFGFTLGEEEEEEDAFSDYYYPRRPRPISERIW